MRHMTMKQVFFCLIGASLVACAGSKSSPEAELYQAMRQHYHMPNASDVRREHNDKTAVLELNFAEFLEQGQLQLAEQKMLRASGVSELDEACLQASQNAVSNGRFSSSTRQSLAGRRIIVSCIP